MTEAEARTLIERKTAWDEDPMLSTLEVDGLLAASVVGSSWDTNAAAAEGWRWKAAKVAGKYDFAIDNQDSRQSQAFEQCLAMAEYFDGLASGGSELGGGGTAAARGMRVLRVASPTAVAYDELLEIGSGDGP